MRSENTLKVWHAKKGPRKKYATVSYDLPERMRVRVRIVPAKKWALILKTLVDWEVREAGQHTEKWDGRDESGNRLDLTRCSVIVETEDVFTPQEIAKVRARVKKSGKRPPTLRGHLHALHEPGKCHELRAKIAGLAPGTKVSGVITLKSMVDGKRRGYGKEAGHGIRYYMDYDLIHENEEEKGPRFSFKLDTRKFGNGRHMLSVSICDHNGHVGTDTIPLNIQNHPKPPPGPDYSANQEEACCGPIQANCSNRTPSNEDNCKDKKKCGNSWISTADGSLTVSYDAVKVGRGLGAPLHLRATYRGYPDTRRLAAYVVHNANALMGWRQGLSGKPPSAKGQPRIYGSFGIAGRVVEANTKTLVRGGLIMSPMSPMQEDLVYWDWDLRDDEGQVVDPGSHIYSWSATVEAENWAGRTSYTRSGMDVLQVRNIRKDSPLGNWQLNMDARLIFYDNGVITLVDEANGFLAFTRNSDGGYSAPPGLDATLEVAGASIRIRMKDGATRVFDMEGRLTAKIDRNNNAMSFAYTGGRLTTVTDAAGRQATLEYAALPQGHRITRIVGPDGRATTFTYDPLGRRLESITAPDGGVRRFAYDSGGRLERETCERGLTTTFAYDSSGRVVRSTDALGNATTYSYDIEPELGWGYEEGEINKVTNPAGDWEILRHNPAGGLTSRLNSLGHSLAIEYDPNRHPIKVTEGAYSGGEPRVSSFSYDALGNVSRVVCPDGGVYSLTYEPTFSQIASITDPLGATQYFAYDRRGNLIRYTDPLGARTRFEYDSKSQLVTVKDPMGSVHSLTYDSHGNVATRTDPLGNTVRFTYGVTGHLTGATDAGGNTTLYEYDAMDRLVRVTDPLGGVVRYQYDSAGNLTSTTDPNGNSTGYAIAACNMVVERVDPLGFTKSYQYDANRNLSRYTKADGRVFRYEHDEANNLVRVLSPDGQAVDIFRDSVFGEAKEVRQPPHCFKFTRDWRSNLVCVEHERADEEGIRTTKIESEYDLAGRRIKAEDSFGRATRYAYDAVGRLVSVVDPYSSETRFEYDRLGRRTRKVLPNGVVGAYAYDDAGRLTGLVHRDKNGSVLLGLDYTYDANSNVTGLAQSDGKSMSMEYDALNRLVSVREPDGTVESYTYDANGNRLTKTRAGQTTTYSFDAANRLTRENSQTFDHDANGNALRALTGGETLKLQWDDRDRLTKIVYGDGTSEEHEYDPWGRRVRLKDRKGQRRDFVLDGQSILAEVLESGENFYAYGGLDEPLLSARGADDGAVVYYLGDRLSTVRGLTDQTGVLAQTYDFDVWGHLLGSTDGIPQPYGFTGREMSEPPGLYYYRRRFYNPSTGRFLSVDPFVMITPADANPYVYVRNNPATLVDPMGLFLPFVVPILIGAAGGALAYGVKAMMDPDHCASLLGFGIYVGAGALLGMGAGAQTALLIAAGTSSGAAGVAGGVTAAALMGAPIALAKQLLEPCPSLGGAALDYGLGIAGGGIGGGAGGWGEGVKTVLGTTISVTVPPAADAAAEAIQNSIKF